MDNENVKVPSYEFELYDSLNGTDIRYGLKPGQTFVNGVIALDAILADLTDPNIDFSPIDISDFLITYNNFTTKTDQLNGLKELYTNFKSEHVNRIFFKILHIAFSNKSKWEEFFKTSFISLHGVKLLQTAKNSND